MTPNDNDELKTVVEASPQLKANVWACGATAIISLAIGFSIGNFLPSETREKAEDYDKIKGSVVYKVASIPVLRKNAGQITTTLQKSGLQDTSAAIVDLDRIPTDVMQRLIKPAYK